MLNIISNKISNLDVHTKEVFLNTSASTIVKVSGILISLLLSIILGNLIGVHGLGIIELCNQIINILIVIALFGTAQVIIKEVSIGKIRKNNEHIYNVLYTSILINGFVTLTLILLFYFFIPYLTESFFNIPEIKWPLTIALIAMIPQVISRVFSSSLIGLGKIWQSNLVNQSLSAFSSFIIILILWFLNIDINVIIVALVYAFSRIVVSSSMFIYHRKVIRFSTRPKYIGNKILNTSIPLLFVTLSSVLLSNSSGIILGWFSNAEQVGLFAVAARLALITVFFLQVTNSAISPKLAALFSEKKIKEMEKMLQKVTQGLGIVSLIPLVIYILIGKFILKLWGEEFTEAYWILVILSIGQFFNIATGATGLTLIMCGYEKLQSKISIIMLFCNILLNITLIYLWGAMGAAIAVAVCLIIENLLKIYYVWKKIGITTISFFK